MALLIDQDFQLKPHLSQDEEARKSFQESRLATETLAKPLTILAALEKCFPDIAQRETLSLYLIGAGQPELDSFMSFEELLHLLPKLRSLTTWMIGPEMTARNPGDVTTPKPISLGCCPVCERNGMTRTCRVVGGKYHDFFTTKEWSRPDLAVMFHSGHTQEYEKDFAPTVKLLVEEKHHHYVHYVQ